MPRGKMKISDRAKIFAPFDALKGFREMLNETGKFKEKRITLAEDYLEDLNKTFNELEPGKMIYVKYYDDKQEKYIEKTGVLSKINLYHKRITVCKDLIPLKEVIQIRILENAF